MRFKHSGKVATFAVAVGLAFAPGAAVSADAVPGKDAKKFEVVLTGLVVEPHGKSRAIGEDIEVKEHDVLLDGNLSWFATAKLSEPVTVRAVDTDFPIPAETNLRLAARAVGGDLATLPPQANVYCDELRTDRAKALGQLVTLGLSSLGARLAKETQLCLVDADNNSEFEKAFVVGTKKGPDRHMVDITPVKYTSGMFTPLAGESGLQVEFLDGGLLSGPSLSMKLKISGNNVSFAALRMFRLDRRASGQTLRVPFSQGIKTNKLPQSLSFGGARVTIKAFDKKTKLGKVTVERDWVRSGFVIEYAPQVIYIYY